MKGDASKFGNKAQGRVKTRHHTDTPVLAERTRRFHPYRARDRPVSDYQKRYSEESRDGVKRRVRTSHGTTESEIDPYPIVR